MKKVMMMLGLMGVATLSQAASLGGEGKTNTAPKAVEARLSVSEVAAMMGQEEEAIVTFFELGTQQVKVYNAQDELVAEGQLNAFGQADDAELAEVLRQADRLMTLGDTQFYRLD